MSRRPPLGARAAVAVLAALVALAPARASADDAPAPVLLESPGVVDGLRIADADGDGVQDVLVVAGREVLVWRGVRGGAPAPAPTWTFRVPDGATYVWPRPLAAADGSGRTASLLALAGSKALRLLPGKPPIVEEGLAVDVPWNDAAKAVLTEFVQGPSILLPTATGFRWIPDAVGARASGYDLDAPPSRRLTPPGPFLEDAAVLTSTWPAPTLVPAAGAAPAAVYLVGDEGLRRFRVVDGKVETRRLATDFLPKDGDRRDVLVDLDGDGTPDLVHEQTSNDSGTYTFFRTPPLDGPEGGKAPDLRPARGTIRLTGFQLPADYVDLDGDGRPDFVVTTIDIDGSNVLRAVMQHRVVAKTRAFRNRGAAGGGSLFPPTPDAEVESDVGVRILFTFSGSIEVKRSFTILATADVDGDGRKDLVIRTAGGALSVRRGAASGVWEKDAREVAIPPVGASPDVEGYVGDVSGDGKDDVVLLYRAPPGGKDRTAVVVSR